MYCVPFMNRLNNVRTISQTLQNKLVVLVMCLVTVGYYWLLWLHLCIQLCDYHVLPMLIQRSLLKYQLQLHDQYCILIASKRL